MYYNDLIKKNCTINVDDNKHNIIKLTRTITEHYIFNTSYELLGYGLQDVLCIETVTLTCGINQTRVIFYMLQHRCILFYMFNSMPANL